jgi:acyl carrier protein
MGDTRTMDRSEALSVLQAAASETLSVDTELVTETARFKEDLGADSLDLVEFVMALEERLDIAVPEEDLEGIATVGEALDLVLSKLAAKA